MYNSEGLCGNYNGIRDDDRVPRDLTNPYPNYLDPILYSASFMYVDCIQCILDCSSDVYQLYHHHHIALMEQ